MAKQVICDTNRDLPLRGRSKKHIVYFFWSQFISALQLKASTVIPPGLSFTFKPSSATN